MVYLPTRMVDFYGDFHGCQVGGKYTSPRSVMGKRKGLLGLEGVWGRKADSVKCMFFFPC